MKVFLVAPMVLIVGISCNKPTKELKEASVKNEIVIDQPEEMVQNTKERVETPTTDSVVEDEEVIASGSEEPLVLEEEIVKHNQEETSSKQVTANESEVPKVVESKQVEAVVPSHGAWDQLLKKYVSATGNVNYQGIKGERAKLDTYLKLLKENPVQSSWSRNDRLTYWINAYNAFTVDLILRNYPLKSIMDLDKPWDQKFIQLGSKNYSLNQIEHEIVRPRFKDARIHFAFVCAAASCPKLLNQAFKAAILNQQLDSQTRYFLNTSGKNKLTADAVEVSQLFNWYGDDFKTSGTIIDFLNKYSEKPIKANATIKFADYDWTLNE